MRHELPIVNEPIVAFLPWIGFDPIGQLGYESNHREGQNVATQHCHLYRSALIHWRLESLKLGISE